MGIEEPVYKMAEWVDRWVRESLGPPEGESIEGEAENEGDESESRGT